MPAHCRTHKQASTCYRQFRETRFPNCLSASWERQTREPLVLNNSNCPLIDQSGLRLIILCSVVLPTKLNAYVVPTRTNRGHHTPLNAPTPIPIKTEARGDSAFRNKAETCDLLTQKAAWWATMVYYTRECCSAGSVSGWVSSAIVGR